MEFLCFGNGFTINTKTREIVEVFQFSFRDIDSNVSGISTEMKFSAVYFDNDFRVPLLRNTFLEFQTQRALFTSSPGLLHPPAER